MTICGILQILEELALSYEHMPSGIDDISIVLRERQLTPEIEATLMKRLEAELSPDELRITHNLSMIMIVGEGMRQRIGVTADSTAALAQQQINLEMINQGSSEVSIMFGIRQEQEKKLFKRCIKHFSTVQNNPKKTCNELAIASFSFRIVISVNLFC